MNKEEYQKSVEKFIEDLAEGKVKDLRPQRAIWERPRLTLVEGTKT